MTDTPHSFRQTPIGRFLCAPIEPRSYANLLFLAMAFPLGLAYFIFLVVGLSLGVGLLIIWVGIPILALVLAGSWLLAAMERQLAIHLLGAEVPPMKPQSPDVVAATELGDGPGRQVDPRVRHGDLAVDSSAETRVAWLP